MKRGIPESAKMIALQRNAELRSLCADVGRETGFDRSTASNVDRLILAKIEVFADWQRRHGQQLRAKGYSSINSADVLEAIGHAGHPVSATIRRAAYRVALTNGIHRTPLRHDPPDEIDEAIDRYVVLVLERGKGPPRIAVTPTRLSRQGAAIEIGCEPEDLDRVRVRRLRLLAHSVEEAGDLFDEAIVNTVRSANGGNPAVPALVAQAIRKAGGVFPENPMQPGRLDVPAFADAAGVSVRDIDLSGEAAMLIDEAIAAGSLARSPFLAARKLTWHDLQEFGRKERRKSAANHKDPAVAARASVGALKRFRLIRDYLDLGAPVPFDFEEQVAVTLAANPQMAPSGWAAKMRTWVGWAREARAAKPLPEVFASALSVLCAERGIGEATLLRAVSDPWVVKYWLQGRIIPSMSKAQDLRQIEKTLDVPEGSLRDLLFAEWRARRFDLASLEEKLGFELDPRIARHLPEDFPEWDEDKQLNHLRKVQREVMRQNTEHSRRIGDMSRDRYRLKPDAWPEAMKEAWAAQQPSPDEDEGMPRPGATVVPEAVGEKDGRRRDEWRKGTVNLGEGLLGDFFGYLIRPRKLDEEHYAAQSRKTDFRPEAGLGIPVKHITPAIFAFPDLVATWAWWRKRRSGGRVPSIGLLIRLARDFTAPNTGVVWKTPGLISEMREFKKWWDANPHDMGDGPKKLDIAKFKDWKVGVEKSHATLSAYFKDFNRGNLPPLRDPFIVIDNFLKKGMKPMEEYMKGVHVLLDSRPHSILSKHVHTRNCILTLILVQTGLRASTLLLRCSGPKQTLFRDEDEKTGKVTWRITIPAEDFKNSRGPFFKSGAPYDFDLEDEDGLYRLLDDYMSRGRVHLLRGRESDALFVTSRSGDLSVEQLNLVYRVITRYYFVDNGLPNNAGIKGANVHGPHAVRHLIASHIVRETGDLYLAGWAIQDSVKTVERYYARFVPNDKAMMAAKVLIRARAASRVAAQTRPIRTTARQALAA